MFLEDFFESLARELQNLYDDNIRMGPARRLRRQLRLMYGRGEIRREIFFRLKKRLDRGEYIDGELNALHREAVRRLEAEGSPLWQPADPQVARSLDRVYMGRAMLEEVRFEMERVLRTIETEKQWMEREAAAARDQAQAALPDETAARTFLTVRQELLDAQQAMEKRLAVVRHDLDRLKILEGQIRLHESELLVVQTREQLARAQLTMQDRLPW